MTDIKTLVSDAVAEAKRRWGDVPVSTKVLIHEDRVSDVLVFHTVDSTDDRVGRVELLWNKQFHEEAYVEREPADDSLLKHMDIDEDVERLRSEQYWVGDT